MVHDADVRGQVTARLASGESASRVSRESGVPLTTVRLWRDQDIRGTAAPPATPAAVEKKALFHEAVWQFASVAVYAMTTWADTLSDPTYQRGHDPDKLAIAFGVLGDKVAGLAASMETMGASRLEAAHAAGDLDGALAAG